jgi:hypothetical protein
MHATYSRFAGLPLALALGAVLLVLSYARLYGDSQSAFFTGGVFTSLFAGPIWGTALAENIALFLGGQLLLHLGFGVLCWALALVSFRLWPAKQTTVSHHVLLWFLAILFAVFASNAATTPHSALGEPYARTAQMEVAGLPLYLWIVLPVAAAAFLTLVLGLRRLLLDHVRARLPVAAIAGVTAVATALALVLPEGRSEPVPGKPNVILIGIDSLRTDIVYPASPERMPHLHEFLSGATKFNNAVTPLARTFPSVTSILTGRRPHSTGAVINLLPRDLVREGDTLPRMLSRAGYHPVYATDEVRFSNIDASYGFDTTVMPPIGASDFLLPFLGDTPLSNTVMNTWIGALLFPHVHANRGANITYDPDRFVHRMDTEIEYRQPMFMIAHLTLAHWPYTWRDSPRINAKLSLSSTGPPKEIEPRKDAWPKYYLEVVKRADRQFGDVMAMLERKGVLNDAIVVVYSDHGETFGFKSEMMAPLDTSALASVGEVLRWGHGTSVLMPQQYRIVLAVRGYGRAQFGDGKARETDAPVATYDIAPTIADLLRVQPKDTYQGLSLAPLLREEPGAASRLAGRIRFTETEFTPLNIATPTTTVSASALGMAAAFYRVDPETDRLELKRDMLHDMFQFRHYAAIGDNLLLAAIPGNAETGFRYLVLGVDGSNPRRLLTPPQKDSPAEVHELWKALHEEFGYILQKSSATTVSGEVRQADTLQRGGN